MSVTEWTEEFALHTGMFWFGVFLILSSWRRMNR